MAHRFKIMDDTGTLTTYTDYDSIPLATLKHVIAFEPDLGTLVTSNEIVLETDTLDSGETDNFVEESATGIGDNLVLNGTDSSSTNAGSNLIMESGGRDGRHKLVPEDFTDGHIITTDISLATFVKSSSALTSTDGDVRDVKFNNDGTKMFMLGRANDGVYEYSVGTAWDVSTITFVRSLDIGVVDATQGDNAANSLEFNTDGTKMFVLGQGNDNVDEYALTTGFDLSTATFTDSFDVSTQELQPYGLAFNNDGTKMYITGWRGDDVNEYTLTTGFDVSTASYSQNFSVSAQEARPSAVQFNSNGTTMYVLGGHTDPIIYQYTLTTAFDISTASYSGSSFSVLDEESKPRGFCFGDNGTKLFVCGWHGDDINLYTTSGSSTAGEENHLMLETASDDQTINHYHLPAGPHHTAGDGHTEAEHRELALWNYKLQLLMIQERS